MDKLKPCPFCGSLNVYKTFEHGHIDYSAIIFCNACKVSVKLEENDQEGINEITEHKAIEAWNRRRNLSDMTAAQPEVPDICAGDINVPSTICRQAVKGQWVYTGMSQGWRKYECSECGDKHMTGDEARLSNFCSNCGADMRGGNDVRLV